MKKNFLITIGAIIGITTMSVSQFHLIEKVDAYEKDIVTLKEQQIIISNKLLENNNTLNNRITNTNLRINELNKLEEQEQESYIEKNAIVSYYTHLPDEGGGLGITASGNKVSNTSVAIPRKDDLLNFGDTIIFEDLSPKYMADYDGQHLTRVADDTGNPKYIRKVDDNTYRLDVYCPKLPNETNLEYKKRVLSYGKTETKIKIKNKE